MDTDQTKQWRLPDELWEHVEYLLPERKQDPLGRGRPPKDDRVCMDAIFYVLRTGCQWKALDATVFCPGSTAHDRFQEWVKAGVFIKMWENGLLEYDYFQGIDWSFLSMDGSMGKAPLGGEKTGKNPTDRGKRGVKRSVLTEGNGMPVGIAVEGANCHDKKMVEATLQSIPIDRPQPTAEESQGMCMDKGYDYDDTRELVKEFGFTAHIKARGEEAQAIKKSGLQSTALGRRTHAQLVESLSWHSDSLA
jgi:putative transposase